MQRIISPRCTIHSCRAYLLGVPIAVTVHDEIASVYFVQGASMQPALNPFPDEGSDWVLANRFAGKRLWVRRGDVVVLKSPEEPHKMVIKRLMAMEGDVITTPGNHEGSVKVPKGFCWVEGDNRWGAVRASRVGLLVQARGSADAGCTCAMQAAQQRQPEQVRGYPDGPDRGEGIGSHLAATAVGLCTVQAATRGQTPGARVRSIAQSYIWGTVGRLC